MIISIGDSHPAAERTIEFVWVDPTDHPRTPNYYETLKSLDSIPGIDALIIPSKPNCDYSLRVLLEHIRLSAESLKINRLPVYVILENEKDFDKIFKSIEEISNAFNFIGSEEKTLSIESNIDDLEYSKLLPLLGKVPQLRDRHSLANIWGPYRILDQIDQLGYKSTGLKDLESTISVDVYFKKLLTQIERTNEFGNDVDTQVRTYFELIKSRHLKVAIIDDDYEHGWDIAYSALLPGSTVKGFEYEGGESFPLSRISEFDLIILDLRLTEVSQHNETDILDIGSMSGMQKLRETRAVDPLIPIIMCTASNKSWSSQTAIDCGASGYWEKESPDWGIGSEYNLKNTLNLLFTIQNVLAWSDYVNPIVADLRVIEKKITDSNYRRRIHQKIDAIIGQLHRPQSTFIRENFHFDGEVVAFLIVWSIGNEITWYFKQENNNVTYTDLGSETKYFAEDIGNYMYQLSSDAIDLFGTSEDSSFSRNHYERLFTKYLFYLRKMKLDYSRYDFLRKVRNNLDYIHGKPGKSKRSLSYNRKYLKELTSLWVKFLKMPSEQG
ncbi:MAG: response regulator [Candidatus Heimdallarchaeaceae archaeon]